jgi:hypothetical protein
MKLHYKGHALCLGGPLLATWNRKHILVLHADVLCRQVDALAGTDGSVSGLDITTLSNKIDYMAHEYGK